MRKVISVFLNSIPAEIPIVQVVNLGMYTISRWLQYISVSTCDIYGLFHFCFRCWIRYDVLLGC